MKTKNWIVKILYKYFHILRRWTVQFWSYMSQLSFSHSIMNKSDEKFSPVLWTGFGLYDRKEKKICKMRVINVNLKIFWSISKSLLLNAKIGDCFFLTRSSLYTGKASFATFMLQWFEYFFQHFFHQHQHTLHKNEIHMSVRKKRNCTQSFNEENRE